MRILWTIITGFFKWSWRILNFVRHLVANILFLVLLLIVAGVYVTLSESDTQVSREPGALYVNLSGVVVDQISRNSPLEGLSRQLLGASAGQLQENSLFDVVDTIRTAAGDPDITGMVLKLDDFAGADQPSLNYIGKAISEFRKQGKHVYAISGSYSQSQYYLASYADKIVMPPQGGVGIYGFATNTLYYNELLEMLKVKAHIFRVGTYKSAVEPMMRNDMSPEARESTQRFVDILWDNYLTTLAANRKTDKTTVFPGATKMLALMKLAQGDNARYAMQQKLVDEIMPSSVFEAEMVKVFGWDKQNKTFNAVQFSEYAKLRGVGVAPEKETQNIAVVVVQGAIVDGPDAPGMAGGDAVSALIREARLNPDVKALVLRVNSPGGSVTASDQIRAEVAALKQAGKPVVVSMGGVAASGGYWVSTPADYIVASPSTITGSIGIFGVVTTFEDTLSQIGVHTDGVSTSPLADATATKALTPEFSELMQMYIENGYRSFLTIVAQSRHKTTEEVDKIAQGRVWIGLDAKANGLVDKLGDFDDAVAKAAELANVEKPVLTWMQPEMTFVDKLLSEAVGNVSITLPSTLQGLIPAPVGATLTQQATFSKMLTDPQYRYAFCLNCTDIQ
ncbi:signal peptide peptidase SppA [Morganella psychrotolerans]|uniref:Signal peptide peptidase SppA n=1 Tax=Morganella psychrotolerans TaxID=368603 RepID=A0A5M9R9Y6_9GAMM|nr:signal peptide peptidase SppA [Morganella psychrotolerans]KAA8717022.1 signal peptide peptidase SppA [Morganella psychrotolerans]OBU08655.1 signal peptide peptidase SppA [Morganella psychrotolerans]